MRETDLQSLAEQLLLAVKMEKDTSALSAQLKQIPIDELKSQLLNDDKKKAFWINIYNSYFQILRQEKVEKPSIYKKRLIYIAGKKFSLDEIEHGILRKNKFKYSLGYLPNYFASQLIKSLTVDQLDYRIHFALNCGAKSCPPIAFYRSIQINEQLDMATQSFLETESQFNHDKKIIYTSSLFKWYLADFGAQNGIQKIFELFLDRSFKNYAIRYTDYSWEEELGNFKT